LGAGPQRQGKNTTCRSSKTSKTCGYLRFRGGEIAKEGVGMTGMKGRPECRGRACTNKGDKSLEEGRR